jgi:hypothetical protein
MLGWVLFFIAVSLVIWYYRCGPEASAAARRGRRNRRRRRPPGPAGRWRAVEVFCPPEAELCPAVTGLLERRFLVREAPPLPIRDCANPHCRCYYEHLEDRRQGDRRAGHGLHESVSAGLGISDRRTGRDRRHRQPIGSILPQ